MTTPNHGSQSALISYLIYPHWWFIIIAIILGILPDIGRLFQKDRKDWNKFYVPVHDFIKHPVLLLVPFLNIHILEDHIMHDPQPPYGWKWYGIYLEIGLWILMVITALCIW